MKTYELTCLIYPGFSEENLISYLPTKPIKTQLTSSFISLEFYAEPDKIQDLEKKLKDETQIQKYMILVKKPKKFRAKPIRKIAEEFKTQPKKPKVELKEIEKKLDEILKD